MESGVWCVECECGVWKRLFFVVFSFSYGFFVIIKFLFSKKTSSQFLYDKETFVWEEKCRFFSSNCFSSYLFFLIIEHPSIKISLSY